MKKQILLLLLSFNTLLLANDADFDGVEDDVDKCPNTAFSDLVDKTGCKVDTTISNHHFDIILGYSQSKEKESDTTSEYTYNSKLVNLDYYYKKFSLSVASSDYNYDTYSSSSNGFNDFYVNAKYKFRPLNNLSFKLGAGVIVPNDDSQTNKLDYSGSASLTFKANKYISVFGGGSYTVVGDENTTSTEEIYQNSTVYYGGIGFHKGSKAYASLSYSNVSSIYIGSEDRETLYFSASYNITENWFMIGRYGYGLNDAAADQYLSLQIGYFF
ncbi:transporter [Sulfurimonas sp.]|uniref:transporter n=1 Tax=Sulfurimonas sp. TaxID=2022749 RepID=UPI003D12F05F